MATNSSSSRLRFGREFSVLARQWRRTIDRCLERAGLSDATWTPLIHLREAGDGISQKDLAALVGIDSSSLVRLLDILTYKGLIERQVDETDRRARLIFLTRAGHEAVAEIHTILADAEATLLHDLSDAELDAIVDAFGRIGKRLKSIQDRP